MTTLANTPFDELIPNITKVRSSITGTVGTIIHTIIFDANDPKWNEVIIGWDTGNMSCDYHDKLHMVHVI